METELVKTFDWGLFFTILGTGVTILAVVNQFFRNFKSDINEKFKESDKKFEKLDNRIFELAMGKSLKDILLAEKKT